MMNLPRFRVDGTVLQTDVITRHHVPSLGSQWLCVPDYSGVIYFDYSTQKEDVNYFKRGADGFY